MKGSGFTYTVNLTFLAHSFNTLSVQYIAVFSYLLSKLFKCGKNHTHHILSNFQTGKKNRARLSSCSSIQKKREKKIPICMPQKLLKLKYFIFHPLCKIVLLRFYWDAISEAFTRPKVAKKDDQDRVYNWRSIRQDHKSTTTNSRELTLG